MKLQDEWLLKTKDNYEALTYENHLQKTNYGFCGFWTVFSFISLWHKDLSGLSFANPYN